ncbi:MAG: YihY/virulence factor BrkB family protein [Smithella sp.]|nr:YihY/virulence factor BrkB family protein [Smithella sp.]
MMKKIWGKIQEATNFIKNDIWRIRRAHLPPSKSFLVNLVRVLLLSIRGFDEDKCYLRASALTFYSLISVVPVVAMAFGIAKGFGFEKLLEEQLRSKLAGHEEIIANVIQFSHSLLENTRGGLIAGIGLVVLLWAVVKVLRQIEISFNDIWGIKEQRTVGRMFGDYLSLMLVCPFLLILSGGVTVFITTQIHFVVEKFSVLGGLGSLFLLLMEILPYTLMWFLFTFLYIFMPNTKVRFSSGLVAGVVAGTAFQVVQLAYITFQVGVANYNAIYGSFAALPLFLMWVQLSWLIILFGAEIAFAYQNADTYEFESDFLQASRRLRVLLSLMVTGRLIKNFVRGDKPMTAAEISIQLEIPIRFVNEILFDLVKSGIISIAEIDDGAQRGYQPAIDVGALTIKYVIDAIEKRGINKMFFTENAEFESLSAALDALGRNIEELPENRLLKEI